MDTNKKIGIMTRIIYYCEGFILGLIAVKLLFDSYATSLEVRNQQKLDYYRNKPWLH